MTGHEVIDRETTDV